MASHPCRNILMLLLALVAASAGALPAAEEESEGATAPRVGVLYLERVFDESRLVEMRSDELRQAGGAVKAQVDQLNQEIDRKQSELSTYHSSTEKHQALKDEIELLALRRKLYVERHKERLDVMELNLLRQSYLDIRLLLNEYCDKQGIAMVFLAPSGNLQASRPEQLQLRLATQNILYHRAGLDITDAFLAYLDEIPDDRLKDLQGAASPDDEADGGEDEDDPRPTIDLGDE